ncbi:MAG: hypothetical protein DWQ20_05295 [Actinobacteria bacterium]|nr:MAG: hypothetical protein DWQ20_05295 [Actinomycetota bacterium]
MLDTGADVTAIGTGGRRYAMAFIEDESVPFEVLLDEDGEAAGIVGTNTLTMGSLVRPRQVVAGARATLKGKRQHNLGRRPMQLGATLVIGPGGEVLYEDFEDFAGDHADLDEIISILSSSRP